MLKLTIYFALMMILAVGLAVGIGYVPTQNRWGEPGIASMTAVAVICLGSAIVAMLPMVLVAPLFPDQIGPAALGGTVIRLLLTMGVLIGYQTLQKPHMVSFLFWAPIVYLLLLAIETTFGVIVVKRFYRTTPKAEDGAVS